MAPEEMHHRDVVHFALERLQTEMKNGEREKLLTELKDHLAEAKKNRAPSL